MKNKLQEFSKKINPYTLSAGAVLMGISGIPQIIQMVTTQSSEGVNPWFIGAVMVAIATFINNGYNIYLETNDPNTMKSQVPNFVSMLIIFILIFVYR